MKTKICSICKKELSTINFCKSPTGKYGVYSICKKCDCERNKKYCKKHKIEISKREEKRSKCPKRIYYVIEKSAKIRKMEFNLPKNDFISWYDNQEKKCYYCKRTVDEIKQDIREAKRNKNRLSIDRKNNKKGYELNNIVLACYRCNTIKGNYFTEQEMLKIVPLFYKRKNNF